MAEGWISLRRSIQEHWLWKGVPYDKLKAWIDLLLLANYEDKKVPYKDGIKICKRGDVNLSISYLAERWKWDRKTVTKFLTILEADGMVTRSSTAYGTTITIVNYDFYQCVGTTLSPTKSSTKSQQSGQQSPTTNKDNNLNNSLLDMSGT